MPKFKIFTDTTELKHAGKDHKHAEKVLHRYEQIIEAIPSHMSFLNRNYVYLAVNKAYLQSHQKKREEIIGHSVVELLGANLFEQSIKEKLDSCLAGEEIHYQAWFSFPEAGQRYMDVSYYPYFNDEDEITGVIVSSHDTTEQKEYIELLQENEVRYHQMFETNAAVKLIIDPSNGRIVEGNVAACEFYGYDYNLLTSLNISDINVWSDEKIQQEMVLAKASKRLFFNCQHKLASGEIRDVEVYSGPIQSGEKTYIYSIIHDTTDRHRAELELQELAAKQMAAEVIQKKSKEVEEANIALRVLIKQYENIEESMQQNILAQLEKVVVPYISLLRQLTQDDKGKEYLDIITDHLHTVGTSFVKKLSNPNLGLTKREILVADMVRQGKSTQDIANLFNLQTRTVEVYRTKIRKKLSLNNKKISLTQYLSSTFTSDK